MPLVPSHTANHRRRGRAGLRGPHFRRREMCHRLPSLPSGRGTGQGSAGPNLPLAPSKLDIELPTEVLVKGGSAPADGFVNPKVEPGKVHWHGSFGAACEASKKSGKPVFAISNECSCFPFMQLLSMLVVDPSEFDSSAAAQATLGALLRPSDKVLQSPLSSMQRKCNKGFCLLLPPAHAGTIKALAHQLPHRAFHLPVAITRSCSLQVPYMHHRQSLGHIANHLRQGVATPLRAGTMRRHSPQTGPGRPRPTPSPGRHTGTP